MQDGVPLGTVREAVYASLTAEFATASDGRPATVPVTPMYDRDQGVVVVSASPAFAAKATRAAANPQVSLLLYGKGDERVHLTGRATVEDTDLEANAAVVEQLLREEPATPKRAAMLDAIEFMQTRLGLCLLDWYGLRVLVEIEPETVERYSVDAETSESSAGVSVPAWPAAGVSQSEAATYDRAVATIVDETDTPQSWPLVDLCRTDDQLRLDPPSRFSPADGQPACVLLHWHTDDLSALEQRLVRGRCRMQAEEIVFEPASSVHLRNRTPLDRVRFIIDGKRRTRAYYAERGDSYWFVPGLKTLLGW